MIPWSSFIEKLKKILISFNSVIEALTVDVVKAKARNRVNVKFVSS